MPRKKATEVLAHLGPGGHAVSRRYRNRRIGEFLKELDLTEGRSTRALPLRADLHDLS
ncbi:MAG: hypothetical protein KAY24_05800 [Candidatus Eisenbacteria sp.]|nr:hypothetical protein [Candidatus Eisenbacteria bacterium]